MLKSYTQGLDRKIIILVVCGILLISVVDTFILKLYDLSSKQTFSTYFKKFSFSIIVLACVSLQLYLFLRTRELLKNEPKFIVHSQLFHRTAIVSYSLILFLTCFLIFEIFYLDQYSTLVLVMIVVASSGSASFFVGITARFFYLWYHRRHDRIILMYFVSMMLILANIMFAPFVVSIFLFDRPLRINEFIGGTMDITAGKFDSLVNVYKFSSVLSFLSIWITTVVFSYFSRDEIVHRLRYLVMPLLLLTYFFVSYFSEDLLNPLFIPFLKTDPVLFSSVLLIIFALIKPIGGVMFGITFWSIAKTVTYEKRLTSYLIITGIGFVFLFTGDQSAPLVLAPFPPFGIGVITILITGSYLITVGIHTSAVLVSKNNDLRKNVHLIARESKLIENIGKAELERHVDSSVNRIITKFETSDELVQTKMDIDKTELKVYLEQVIREVTKDKSAVK